MSSPLIPGLVPYGNSRVTPSTPNASNTPYTPSQIGKGISNDSSITTIVIIGIFLFVVIFFILYKIFKTYKTNLKSVVFAKTPIEPKKELIDLLAPDTDLPDFSNGKEYAYSFWIYIDNVISDSNHGLIFFKSPNSNYEDVNFKDLNTIVYLEKNTNKLKIKLRTLNADQNNVTIDVSNNIKKGIDGKLNVKGKNTNITLHQDTCYYADFTIDYVPLQRWVNITINIDNNLVSIFLDGDLLSTKNLSSPTSTNCKNLLSTIISNKAGNIFVGSDKKNNLQTFNGLISNFTVFNYSITMDHVKTIYSLGPISKSPLSTIGLPLYGVRNPFYRVDDIKNSL